jgi:hypothetical protein
MKRGTRRREAAEGKTRLKRWHAKTRSRGGKDANEEVAREDAKGERGLERAREDARGNSEQAVVAT